MKKRLFITFSLLGILAACSSPSNQETDEKEDSKPVEETVLQNEDNEEPSAEVMKLKLAAMTFEDYVKLNTKEVIEGTFGADNMKEGSSSYQEGEVTYKHTIVTNPATTHEVKYLWNDDGSLSFVEASYYKYDENFEIQGIQSLDSECGISLGMPLADLVAWNGSDIQFSGFGWDYAGGIFIKQNTKLATCPVKVGLDVDYENMTSNITGDIELNTENEEVKNAKIFVGSFTFFVE